MSKIGQPMLQPGDIFYGVTILEVKPAPTLQATQYLIEYHCCKRQRWMSHKVLMLRKKNKSKKCSICIRPIITQSAHERSPCQIDVPGWGLTLGKMGFRYGDRDTQHAVIDYSVLEG